MASNKKGKKSKGVTISFQEFSSRLEGDNTTSGNVVYAEPKKNTMSMSSWADEVEEDEIITARERIVLPTAPRASRGPAYEDSQIPRAPPFQANIGNLHYDIEDEDIYKFFRELEILELKLPRDHATNRIKGFGFVVFGTREDLVEALTMNEQVLRGRPVRVALLSGDQRVGDRDRGDRRGGGSNRGPAEDEGVDNWRDMARGQGQDFPVRPQRDDFRRNEPDFRRNEPDFRRNEPDFRRNDSDFRRNEPDFRRNDSDFRRNDNFPEESEQQWRGQGQQQNFQPDFRRGDSRDDFRGGRSDDFRRSDNYPEEQDFIRPPTQPRPEPVPKQHSPQQQPQPQQQEEQKQRKKLVLLPKSTTTESTATSSSDASRSSIFGEAKPVDTLKRELEIEEKLKQVSVTANDDDDDDDRKVVRLLSRDGSERRVVIDGSHQGQGHAQKWRAPPHQRTNSQSSQHSSQHDQEQKLEHSDPEDDRDLKQQMRGSTGQYRGEDRSRRHFYNERDRDGRDARDTRDPRYQNYPRRNDPRDSNIRRPATTTTTTASQRPRPASSRPVVDKDGFTATTLPTKPPPLLLQSPHTSPTEPPPTINKFAALDSDED